jgi:dipeptidyl aminopeptidase/acylaminoacyl peptidase
LVCGDEIRTPLLIVHSEQDMRCQIEQAEQLYVWLRWQGCPVEFLRFPEESHGLSRMGTPSRRLERLRLIVEWFGKYMAGRGDTQRSTATLERQ